MRKHRTPEEINERHSKRSRFLSRFVDEFKKIAFIALFFVGVGGLVWCLILYSKEVTVPSAVPVALITAMFGSYFSYCIAASKDKDSLNKAGLIKNSSGVITKIVNSVADGLGSDAKG